MKAVAIILLVLAFAALASAAADPLGYTPYSEHLEQAHAR